MRLFIAVNISEENRSKIAQIQSELKKNIADVHPVRYDKLSNGVKWIEKENLHLTLKFLGEVADEQLVSIKEKIKEVSSSIKGFEIDFCSLGVFPSETFYKILWVGIEKGQAELKNLAQRLEDLLQGIGFKKEKRPFSAHLTIGRFRKPKPCKLQGTNTEEKFSEAVEKVSLVKSTLTPKGPIYEIIEEFKLGER